MSLLSATQGSPERVWSVLRLLASHGGSLARDDMVAWLNPEFERVDAGVSRQPTAVTQTLDAARGLQLITTDAGVCALTCADPPESFAEFSDFIHGRLSSAAPNDPDRVILEALAWVVLAVERENGFGWLAPLSRK